MTTKLMRQHLPWIAPTIAIVLAASGYFAPNSDEDLGTSQEVSRSAGFEPAMPSSGQVNDADQAAASLAALQSLSSVAPAAPTPTVQPVAAAVTPTPAPAPQPTVAAVQPQPLAQPSTSATLSPTQNPAAFFGAAQANLAAVSCANDLRNLARQAKIYFPAGGLTGEASGIEQARVIGLIAQECPGISIEVQGHSDPSGNPNTNLRLSAQRAEAVISRIAAAGIDTSNFVAKGMGSAVPSGVTGPQGQAYYDRRVEFTIVEAANRTASLSSNFLSNTRQSACAANLQQAVDRTNVFYAPGSVSVSNEDMNAVMTLAAQAASCPDARLRVIGQHSDVPGSGEGPGTGRLRAVVMMSSLVNAGIEAEQVIIAAPSRSMRLPDRPDLSDRRLDFDVILEDG